MLNSQFAMNAVDATSPGGLTLRLEFTRRGDRYGHTISVVNQDGRAVPVLESVEGSASDDWPASPPLQNLSIEKLAPGRRAALLVGMAGRSHWSASIEPVPGEPALVFDVACRTGDSEVSLGSLYRVFSRDTAQIEATVELGCDVQSEGDDRIAIVLSGISGPGTIRWKYRIALSRA